MDHRGLPRLVDAHDDARVLRRVVGHVDGRRRDVRMTEKVTIARIDRSFEGTLHGRHNRRDGSDQHAANAAELQDQRMAEVFAKSGTQGDAKLDAQDLADAAGPPRSRPPASATTASCRLAREVSRLAGALAARRASPWTPTTRA